MTWNYRVTKIGDEFAVREVYYDDYNEVVSWTADPVTLVGDRPKDIRKDLKLIRAAFENPVLDLDHIYTRMSVAKVLDHHLNNGCTDDRCTLEPETGDDGDAAQFSSRLIKHLAEEVQKECND